MVGRKIFLLALLFSSLGVSSAFAQHEFEVTPFGGARFGGVIDFSSQPPPNTPNADYYTIKSTWNYGIMGDYTLFSSVPGFQVEFMYNHQPTDLDQHLANTNVKEFLTSADVDQYEWGFNYTFREGDRKIRPFVVGGIGLVHFNSGGNLPFSNRFGYNLGGGIKYFFTRHVGARLEVRWAPARTTTSIELLETPFGTEEFGVNNHAEQGEANLGLIFRWGRTSS